MIATLAVGMPMGFFQSEIEAATGPVWQEVLLQGTSALATFLVCACFAYLWVQRVYLSAVLSFVGAELFFFALSAVIGSYEQPVALVLLSWLLSICAALGGTWMGLLVKGIGRR
ncbi:hypothetical protein ACK1O1_15350 [Stenotrophomonas maltophilia]|uniref:hypothetical protein n=1 Tax=Stenotrophomonas maltophilia TaxID=40324 RepID=UPI003916E9CF